LSKFTQSLETFSAEGRTLVSEIPNFLTALCRIDLREQKGSPYSITERRVPELIPVLGSQPAGDVSHKPGGRLPLLRQACSYPRNH